MSLYAVLCDDNRSKDVDGEKDQVNATYYMAYHRLWRCRQIIVSMLTQLCIFDSEQIVHAPFSGSCTVKVSAAFATSYVKGKKPQTKQLLSKQCPAFATLRTIAGVE